MKRSTKALAALLAAVLCLGAAALAEGRVTTTGSVKLRRGPGLDYAAITTVDQGVALDWDDTALDGRGVTWYRVDYDGRIGWISSRYTGDGIPADAVTTAGSIRLRAGAGTGYRSLRLIDRDTTLTYFETDVDANGMTWYRVSYRGDAGWICAGDVRGSGDCGAPEEDEGRVITTGSVHLRAGAGLDYASRAVIDAGVTLTYDDTALDGRGVAWYRVSYLGEQGWVSSRYARKGNADDGERRVRVTGSVNVRSDPGLDGMTVGVVGAGTALTYQGQTRQDERGVAWYAVSFRGELGWVSSRCAALD